jgi:hypothetical protein
VKKFFFLILISLPFISFSQDKVLIYKTITCEDGIEDAIEDFSNEKYKIISYGLIASTGASSGFSEFYNDFIYKNYKIILENGGCVTHINDECYKEKMTELIKEKYGENVFEKAKLEAINEFKKTAVYKKNVQSKIDSNEPFFSVHQEPQFYGGDEALESYLGRSVRVKVLDSLDFESYILAYFIVEKDGSINEVVFKDSESLEELSGKEIKKLKKLFANMPKWKPGEHFGEIVRARESIKIVL